MFSWFPVLFVILLDGINYTTFSSLRNTISNILIVKAMQYSLCKQGSLDMKIAVSFFQNDSTASPP